MAVLCLAPIASACSGSQSALDPAGEEAEQIFTLFFWMCIGGAIIWAGVISLLLYASSRRVEAVPEEQAAKLILWGGVVFPVSVLFALLCWAFWMMPGLRPWAETSQPARLEIDITGRQFWWRVAYRRDGSEEVVAANELRLPVGERVRILLRADDVIHSFWVPALAGKMDMVPGRTNILSLMATKPGTYRGACTEFCGTSHALMALNAVVVPRAEFDAWLDAETAPSPAANEDGLALFLRHGCSACHAIRGTEARGDLGPDLSHVGSRTTIGAGILPNTEAAIAGFIVAPGVIKPDSHMPSFAMLDPAEVAAIASYLKGLE